jgi:recombinational DNA repair ATPase RecF
MVTTLKEALQQLETLAAELSPEAQEQAARQLTALAEELKRQSKWDALLATPESQAFLAELSAELDEEIAAGTTVEGGWSL